MPGIFSRLLSARRTSTERKQLVRKGSAFPPSTGFDRCRQLCFVGYAPGGQARAIRFYDDVLRTARDVAPLLQSTVIILGRHSDAVWTRAAVRRARLRRRHHAARVLISFGATEAAR